MHFFFLSFKYSVVPQLCHKYTVLLKDTVLSCFTDVIAHLDMQVSIVILTLMTARTTNVKMEHSVLMQLMDIHVFAQKDTGENDLRQYKHVCLISKLLFLEILIFLFVFSGLFCEFSPPMVLPRTSPCDNYECQNGAQCIIKESEPICQCLSGYQGEKCEKLISINFVNKESYLQIPSAKIRPQTNITLQVRLLVLQILIWKSM